MASVRVSGWCVVSMKSILYLHGQVCHYLLGQVLAFLSQASIVSHRRSKDEQTDQEQRGCQGSKPVGSF